MTRCSTCEDEDRERGRYCESCGERIEPEKVEALPVFSQIYAGEEASAGSTDNEDSGQVVLTVEEEGTAEPAPTGGEGQVEATGEAESSADVTDTDEAPQDDPEAQAPADVTDADEAQSDSSEGEASADAMETEDAATAPSRTGYLVFPDGTEQPIPPSQWAIGRADLSKYLSDPEKSPEISRGHFTVFQEGEQFFVEDGKTMVQEKPSANKTWIIRNGAKILVTGTGRNELQEGDEIDIAELVKLQFVAK